MYEHAVIKQRFTSGCIVSLVDGRAWNAEDVGSNPTTQTKFL